jgi:hypothetical protein
MLGGGEGSVKGDLFFIIAGNLDRNRWCVG